MLFIRTRTKKHLEKLWPNNLNQIEAYLKSKSDSDLYLMESRASSSIHRDYWGWIEFDFRHYSERNYPPKDWVEVF